MDWSPDLAEGLAPYAPVPTLEQLLTEDFGLDEATPLQRAICRIADGLPLGELRDHPHVVAAIGRFGGPRFRPETVALVSAIRGAKSLIASCAGVRCALTCDVDAPGLLAGEMPRVSILSVRKDQANVILGHIAGALRTSDRLRAHLLEEPRGERIILRHPGGFPVEVLVVAGTRAGASLTARWMAAVIFDEAPRMVGADEGVVNLEHARAAVAGRLLSCACSSEWLIGSPWAPFGPVYGLVLEHFQRPSRACVVVKARGDWLNPRWWTREQIAKIEKRPDAYRTDFLAEFADPEEALFSSVDLEACTRQSPMELPPEDGYEYGAEMDPAGRRNAWTLVVCKRAGKKSVVVLAREWRGSKAKPLSPLAVLGEMAEILKPYRVSRVGTDQFATDANRDLAAQVGLQLVEQVATQANNTDGYLELRARVSNHEVELPPDRVLLADLRRLTRRVTQAGVVIHLPVTADGRHCDYAPALMRAAGRFLDQPPVPDERPQWKREQDDALERARKVHGRKPQFDRTGRRKEWWNR